jgi:hypothetical protein
MRGVSCWLRSDARLGRQGPSTGRAHVRTCTPGADARRLHSHAIVSSSVGPEYYVSIMSFVDKTQVRLF